MAEAANFSGVVQIEARFLRGSSASQVAHQDDCDFFILFAVVQKKPSHIEKSNRMAATHAL